MGIRRTSSKTDQNASTQDLQARMAEMEHTLLSRIEQQDVEIAHLRAALSPQHEMSEATESQVATPLMKGAINPRSSRRNLLKIGGATAAGVAVAAVAAINHAQPAQAAGVAWQTGTVNADVETLVKPSSGSYSASDILQVQIGTGSVFHPVSPLKAAITAYDTTTNNVGVYGTSQTGYGLYGVTDTGTGANGAGLNGTATSTGTGVVGTSGSGVGVSGSSSTGIGGSFNGGLAALQLGLAGGAPGAIPTGTHARGEIVMDSEARMLVCSTAGTTGSGSPPSFYRLSAMTTLPAPIRLLDTRVSPGTKQAGGATSTLQVTGVSVGGISIPAGAKGVFGNITIVTPDNFGLLIFYPTGAIRPTTSNINYFATSGVLANFAIVGLSASGQISIYCDTGATHILFDAAGYIF